MINWFNIICFVLNIIYWEVVLRSDWKLIWNWINSFGLVKLWLLDFEFYEFIWWRDLVFDEEEVFDVLNEILKEINVFYDKVLERICVMFNVYLFF